MNNVLNQNTGSNVGKYQNINVEEVLDVKGDDHVDKNEVRRLRLTTVDMWCLGITIVIGGQYFGWNESLQAGFGSTLIATFLMATAYICLVFCIAELSSALPFAGGSYGIARVTLGIYVGCIVAYIDCAESVIYVATSTYLLGEMVTSITGTPSSYEPLYWLIFFVVSISIHTAGGLTFWRLNRALAAVSILLVLIYIFGSIHRADFEEYAPVPSAGPEAKWFQGGGMEFMRILPLPGWFFVGVESINLACKDVAAPKTRVPHAYVACILTLVLACFGVLFTAASLPPGIQALQHELTPLSAGFQALFRVPARDAILFSLPATYATASGFMFCFGRQLRAMGQSGLANPLLGESTPSSKTPFYALMAGSVVALALCFLVHYQTLVRTQLFNLCMMCAVASYFTQFASFVILRTKFATIRREFVSPLGMGGAAYGCGVFFLAFVAICGFQETRIAIVAFVVFVALTSLYYYLVVRARQSISQEEKAVMFHIYLLKSNVARVERLRKGLTPSARIINGGGSGDAFVSSVRRDRSTGRYPGRHSNRIAATDSQDRTLDDSAGVVTSDRPRTPSDIEQGSHRSTATTRIAISEVEEAAQLAISPNHKVLEVTGIAVPVDVITRSVSQQSITVTAADELASTPGLAYAADNDVE